MKKLLRRLVLLRAFHCILIVYGQDGDRRSTNSVGKLLECEDWTAWLILHRIFESGYQAGDCYYLLCSDSGEIVCHFFY